MYLTITFPVVDLRVLENNSSKILSPTWPTPKTHSSFIRNFGCVKQRNIEQGSIWENEDIYCDAKKLFSFNFLSAGKRYDCKLLPVRKRFYSDGYFMNKLDIGFGWIRRDDLNKDVNLNTFLRELYSTPITIKGSTESIPLFKAGKKISDALVRSTTSSISNYVADKKLIDSCEPLAIFHYNFDSMPFNIGDEFEHIKLNNNSTHLSQQQNILLHFGRLKFDNVNLKIWLIGTPKYVNEKNKIIFEKKKDLLLTKKINILRNEIFNLGTIKTYEEFNAKIEKLKKFVWYNPFDKGWHYNKDNYFILCGLQRPKNMKDLQKCEGIEDLNNLLKLDIKFLSDCLFKELIYLRGERKLYRYFNSEEYKNTLFLSDNESRSLQTAGNILRLLLSRIHVEKETLIIILNGLRNIYTKSDYEDKRFLIKNYLKKTSEKLFKKERYNILQDPFLYLALESNNYVNGIELNYIEKETNFFLEDYFKKNIVKLIKNINMGTINNVSGKHNIVVNNSTLNNSLNTIENNHGEKISEAFKLLNEYLITMKNQDAILCGKNLTEEAEKKEPNKPLMKSLWSGIVSMVPVIKDMSVIAETITKLF